MQPATTLEGERRGRAADRGGKKIKPKIATREEILEFATDILRSDFDAEKIKKMELMIKCFPIFGFTENGADTDFVKIIDDIPKKS